MADVGEYVEEIDCNLTIATAMRKHDLKKVLHLLA
jgi:hypothetical protein